LNLRNRPESVAGAIAWAILAATFLLRILYAFRYPFNADEPQHLHVAWAWANGLLQYRDVFDNHTPLFHMLMAPLVAILGDRPDLMILMRLAMLPLFAGLLICTWLIGRALFSQKVGLWAAVCTALMPFFFRGSLEFRTDVLWAACWLLAIALLVRAPLTVRRSFFVGLMIGASAATSLKTTFLFGGMAGAALLTPLVAWGWPWRERAAGLLRRAAAAAAGLLVIPVPIVLFFYAKGALGPFYYGTVQHNLIPFASQHALSRTITFAVCLLLGVLIARKVARGNPPSGMAVRRAFFVLLVAVTLALQSFWPTGARHTRLPIAPPMVVLVAAGLGWLLERKPGRHLALQHVAATAAAIELAVLVGAAPWHSGTAYQALLWQDVLKLTDPGQKVMDAKGELIFRPRGIYCVLEGITTLRIGMGLMPDDIPEQLMASRTCVAARGKSRLPPRAMAFVNANYICVGSLLAAGKALSPAPGQAGPVEFDIRIAASYAIVTPAGAGRGELDGIRAGDARFLDAGTHRYQPAPGEKHLAVVWAQAVQRGFSPFNISPSEQALWDP